jgi:hypothetical protein
MARCSVAYAIWKEVDYERFQKAIKGGRVLATPGL